MAQDTRVEIDGRCTCPVVHGSIVTGVLAARFIRRRRCRIASALTAVSEHVTGIVRRHGSLVADVNNGVAL